MMKPDAAQGRLAHAVSDVFGLGRAAAGYDALFARAGAQDFCLGRAWFEALAATTLAAKAPSRQDDDDRASACLVGRQRERDPAFFGARSFCSLSNYYTLRYAPIVDGERGRAALPALIEGLRARPPLRRAAPRAACRGRAVDG